MLKDPRSFDQTKPLVVAAFFAAHGHGLPVGTPVTVVTRPADAGDEDFAPGEVTLDEAVHLWRGGRIEYAEQAKPTPVAAPVDEATRLTDCEDMGDGTFLIRAPWLEQAITVTGKDAADAAVAETIKKGVLDAGLVVEQEQEPAAPVEFSFKEAGSNGYYEISGPGVTPYKVRGEAAAKAEVEKLKAKAAEGEAGTE